MERLRYVTFFILPALLLGFVVYEGYLRLFFPPPQLVDIQQISSPRSQVSGIRTLERGGSLYLLTESGRRLRPNSIATVSNHGVSNKNVVIRTNSFGYRNPELGPKTKARVLFLGDSITFADSVDEADTFVRQVQTLAEARDFPLETINAGIGAVGLETYGHILEETGLQTEPDLVVIGLYLNDFQSSRTLRLFYPPEWLQWSWAANYLFHTFSKRYADFTRNAEDWNDRMPRIPKQQLVYWSQQIDCCFLEFEPQGKDVEQFKALIRTNIHDWGGAWSTDAWVKMQKVFERMQALLAPRDIPMALILFPVRYQVDAATLLNYPQRRARELARELNVPFLDLLPVLRQAAQTAQHDLFFDHCHYTAQGHRLVSTHVVEFVIHTLRHEPTLQTDMVATAITSENHPLR